MNSVHEQCPNSDSETVLSQNWLSVQCAQPQPSLRAQAAPRPRAYGRVVAAQLVVWWVQCQVPEPCRGLASRPCRDTAACPVPPLGHNTLQCIAIHSTSQASPSHVTIHLLYRDSLTSLASLLTQPQYNPFSCNTPHPSPPAVPVTIQIFFFFFFVLQHTQQHFYTPNKPKSQYNLFYHNTIGQ